MCKQTSESDCVCVWVCRMTFQPYQHAASPCGKYISRRDYTISKNTVSNLCVRVCVCVYSLWLHVMNDLKNNLQSYSPE